MSQTADEKAAKAAEKAQKAAEKAAQEAAAKQSELDTQSIKFLRSHPSYAYWPGDTADLTAEHVTLLVDGGFAKLVVEDETEPKTQE